MTQHTQGEYFVGNDQTENGEHYYYVGIEGEIIATFPYDHTRTDSGDRALADATLYAAAPKLLEALEIARNGLIWFINETGDNSDSNHEALEQIDAAIAAATVQA